MIFLFFLVHIGLCDTIPSGNCSSAYCSDCYESSTVCNECIDYYVNQNGKCVYMKEANCLNRNSNQCIECEVGYQLKNHICEKSNGKCKTYDGNGDCSSCYDGTFTQKEENGSVSCIDCSSFDVYCKNFDDSLCSSCKSCSSASCLLNGKCITPIAYCVKYESCEKCSECAVGFVKSSNGKCYQGTIAHCSEYLNDTHCDNCFDGYIHRKYPDNYLKTDTDSLISLFSTRIERTACIEHDFIEHCQQYSTLEPNLCLQCENGYGFDDDRFECIKSSVDGCLKYSYENYCSQCKNGYYLRLGKCFKCTEDDLNDATKCEFCKSTYKKDNDECIDTHCLNLNIVDGVCITCEDGFMINPTNTANEYCIKSDDPCVEYYETKCLKCSTQYYLNEAFECKKCNSSSCIHCVGGENNCDYNKNYYQPSVSTQCNDPYCSQCRIDGETCLSCWNGEKPNYNVCPTISCSLKINGKCITCSEKVSYDGFLFYYESIANDDGACISQQSGSVSVLFSLSFVLVLFLLI